MQSYVISLCSQGILPVGRQPTNTLQCTFTSGPLRASAHCAGPVQPLSLPQCRAYVPYVWEAESVLTYETACFVLLKPLCDVCVHRKDKRRFLIPPNAHMLRTRASRDLWTWNSLKTISSKYLVEEQTTP